MKKFNIKTNYQSVQFNHNTIESYISNSDFTVLISFPRTGSHWLRMLMELYFEKPSLVRAFYYKNATDFTCYHRHDEKLEVERNNVIYLYRNPVDTIYSQMNYYNEDVNNIEKIQYWAKLYGKHLQKWLIEENFTVQKTILTYEGMKKNIEKEFKKICDHFSMNFNPVKLNNAFKLVSKNEVKRNTNHDPQVINNSTQYKLKRVLFKKKQSNLVLQTIFAVNKKLKDFLG